MLDKMSRAPLVVDLMAFSLAFVVPLVGVGIILVKKRMYRAHRWVMQSIGIGMGGVLLWFEYVMRTIGWRDFAMDSPYYETWLIPTLIVHLLFAIPTLILWVITIYGALRQFPRPPKPSNYSKIHKRQGRLAITLSLGTCLTAYGFYWMAFIA